MPDNAGLGMLENLCLTTIKEDPVYSCIDNFVTCFKKNQIQSEVEKFNESKARVQAYLATRSPIVSSLGRGAQKQYWDFGHPCFRDIIKFLQTLFS